MACVVFRWSGVSPCQAELVFHAMLLTVHAGAGAGLQEGASR